MLRITIVFIVTILLVGCNASVKQQEVKDPTTTLTGPLPNMLSEHEKEMAKDPAHIGLGFLSRADKKQFGKIGGRTDGLARRYTALIGTEVKAEDLSASIDEKNNAFHARSQLELEIAGVLKRRWDVFKAIAENAIRILSETAQIMADRDIEISKRNASKSASKDKQKSTTYTSDHLSRMKKYIEGKRTEAEERTKKAKSECSIAGENGLSPMKCEQDIIFTRSQFLRDLKKYQKGMREGLTTRDINTLGSKKILKDSGTKIEGILQSFLIHATEDLAALKSKIQGSANSANTKAQNAKSSDRLGASVQALQRMESKIRDFDKESNKDVEKASRVLDDKTLAAKEEMNDEYILLRGEMDKLFKELRQSIEKREQSFHSELSEVLSNFK